MNKPTCTPHTPRFIGKVPRNRPAIALFRFLVPVALLASLVCPARAGAILEADPSGAMIDQNAVDDGQYEHLYNCEIGGLFRTEMSGMVDAFPLPYLAPGQQVTGATISYYLEQPNGTQNYNLQLYGLKRVSATSPAPLESDWYAGTNDSANTLLDATYVTPATPINQGGTYSGSNLATFIQKQYTSSAFSALPLSN